MQPDYGYPYCTPQAYNPPYHVTNLKYTIIQNIWLAIILNNIKEKKFNIITNKVVHTKLFNETIIQNFDALT